MTDLQWGWLIGGLASVGALGVLVHALWPHNDNDEQEDTP